MAAQKLTALTALTTLSGDEIVYVVEDADGTPLSRQMSVSDLAAGLFDLIATTLPGYEYDRTEFTSSVSISATTEATANTVVTAAAISFDGATTVDIQFWSPFARATATSGATLSLCLYDGASSIGIVGLHQSQAANNGSRPGTAFRRLTPTNASHTYSIRGFVSSGTGVVSAGAGGVGLNVPGYILIRRA